MSEGQQEKLGPEDHRASVTCPGPPMLTLHGKKSTSIWVKLLSYIISIRFLTWFSKPRLYKSRVYIDGKAGWFELQMTNAWYIQAWTMNSQKINSQNTESRRGIGIWVAWFSDSAFFPCPQLSLALLHLKSSSEHQLQDNSCRKRGTIICGCFIREQKIFQKYFAPSTISHLCFSSQIEFHSWPWYWGQWNYPWAKQGHYEASVMSVLRAMWERSEKWTILDGIVEEMANG